MTSNKRLQLDPQLKLVHNITQPFTENVKTKGLQILHTGYVVEKEIKKGAQIYPGMLIAKHPDPQRGDIFAPVRGKVTEMGFRFIKIEICEAQEEDLVIAPISQDNIKAKLSGSKEDALAFLKSMGVNTQKFNKQCDTLVINGLNSEPGILWAEPLLSVHFSEVLQGLELAKLFLKPKKTVLVIPEGASVSNVPSDVEIQCVAPVYPHSLSAVLRADIIKSEKHPNVRVVSTHRLWGLSRVYSTGMPLTETIVTFGTPAHKTNHIIKNGTLIEDLLKTIAFSLKEGDTVVLDGPLRGLSVATIDRGIPKSIRGVFVVPKGSVPSLKGNSPCCNCGACDRICPANLSPSTISKYSEFGMYDKCEEWYAKHCVECGLCGYVCITRRPVLQYIRLAKQKLAENLVAVTTAAERENEKE